MKLNKYTIRDLQRDFPNDKACLDWLIKYFYPNGIYCKNCKRITKHHPIKSRPSYSCDICGNHVHPTANTIFHKSTTPLTLWFYAIYLMTATRAGISAKQLERELGVTYKTAWRMFHQIRKMMYDDKTPLGGEVEVDETYVGGKALNRRYAANFNEKPKEVVMGMVERGGQAKVRHVISSGTRSLLPQITKNVKIGAQIYTDQWPAYDTLPKLGFSHKSINHLEAYVHNNVHTQNIENLWSHIKRGIMGVYRHVDPKYLQAYVNEYAFRYSQRNNPQAMFWALMERVQKV
ncbi:IS1595 family transposase [Patescibacteria group bacterium]|nr:IS1595 family transposase [Patescibacteria group bacterium]MCL5797885.1 IS1595 family transposase [Patescibacteria group bacterium]